MLDRISDDIKNAMKEKNKEKLEALRFLKSSLLKNKTDAKPLDDESVVINHCKKLQESLALFPANSPEIPKVEAELSYLKAYLPTPLTEHDVQQLIEAEIKKMSAPQFGAVMKEISQKIKGKFDGKRASDLVKEMVNKASQS